MADLVGSDPTFCGFESTEQTEIPTAVLARWAALASERAAMVLVPRQPQMTA